MSVQKEVLWLWAVMVFGVGSKRLWEMSDNYDNIEEFVQAVRNHAVTSVSKAEYERADKISFDKSAEILERCREEGTKYLCYESEGYPERLRRIANPPAMLFYKGNLDFLNDKCLIHVVGTRKPSEYSLEITDRLCKEMTERNIILSSGFAEGIDRRVNNASLAENSFPVAVCGTPFEQDYPKGSRQFKEAVAEKGVLITEYYPTSKIHGGSFIARNRIAVGLSDGVLFIEASRESHGLDNFNHAVYQGKPVFVVPPHDIYDKRYFGQRDLIRNECQPVFGVEDILYTLSADGGYDLKYVRSTGEFSLPVEDSAIFAEEKAEKKKTRKKTSKKKAENKNEATEATEKKQAVDYSALDETQSRICKMLENGSMLVDEISSVSGLDISETLAALTELELEGYVRSLPGKMFGLQ